MDNGSGHPATSWMIPENMVCRFLPPYSPELHPLARLWQEVKAPLAWVVAAAIEEWEHRVERLLTDDSHATLRSLTAYLYVVRAVNAVSS
jgi:transposase